MVKVSAISRDPLIDEFVEMAASARCHVPYNPQSYFVSGGPGNVIYTTSGSKVGCEHALLAICDVLRGSSGMVNADAGSVLECTLCDFSIRVQADYDLHVRYAHLSDSDSDSSRTVYDAVMDAALALGAEEKFVDKRFIVAFCSGLAFSKKELLRAIDEWVSPLDVFTENDAGMVKIRHDQRGAVG